MKKLLTTLFTASFAMSCANTQPLTQSEIIEFGKVDVITIQIHANHDYNVKSPGFISEFCEKIVNKMDIDRYALYLQEYTNHTTEWIDNLVAQHESFKETQC